MQPALQQKVVCQLAKQLNVVKKVDSGTDATVVGRDRTAALTAASAHFNRSRIAHRQFSVWSQFSDDANIYRAAPLRDHPETFRSSVKLRDP